MTPMERGRAAVLALPDSIRVAAFDIAIERFDKQTANTIEAFGTFESSKQTIGIADHLASPASAADTFVHEVLHAIAWAWGLEDGDTEERFVSGLSTGLITVYRDNPWLLPWIERSVHGWPTGLMFPEQPF